MKKIERKEKKYEIAKIIWGNIERYQYLNEITKEQLAESLGVSTKSLYTYKDDPEKLTLKSLEKFIDYNKIDISELIKY